MPNQLVAATPHVVASPGTPFACVVEPYQIRVLELPSLAPIAEIGIDPGTDVAVVGAYVGVLAASGRLYVVDPRANEGPSVVAELDVERGSRIVAASGNHLLIATSACDGIVEVSDNGKATLSRLPVRVKLGIAGPAGVPEQFVLANAGALEEWSAASRSPVRRFRLDRPINAGWVGASARHLWFVADSERDHLIAIKRDGTAPPVRIPLPEPAARVVGDSSGVVAIIGEASRRAWLVRLGDRSVVPMHAGPVDDLALCHGSVLVLAPDSAPELVPLPTAATLPQPDRAEQVRTQEVPHATLVPAPSARDQLDAWKERVADEPHRVVVEPRGWRDELVAWMRQPARSLGDLPCRSPDPVRDVAGRLEIDDCDVAFLYAVYGARLCGNDGVSFADLVDLTAGRWDEALGRGKLRHSGAFVWRRARVYLAPEIAATLDELAPTYGTVVPSAIAARSRVRIVAPRGVPLEAIGAWAAPSLGSLLVPNPRGLCAPARFLLEAKVRGLAPLVPWLYPSWPVGVHPERAVVVVDDARISADLAPIGMVWPVSAAA